MSKGNMLSELIENTASFNKIKTPKSTGEKAKNLFTNIAIALVAIITLPLTLPVALTGAFAYSAYFGVQRLTAYTPDKDTVEKANSSTQGTVKSGEVLDKTMEKSQIVVQKQKEKPILGPHTEKVINKGEQEKLIGSGRGGGG
jgi:hypothetical protein